MSSSIYTVALNGSRARAISVTWFTAGGRAKSLNLSGFAADFIERESGLPKGYSNSNIAYRLGIPLPMLIAIQSAMGIDVRRRRIAYQKAIDRAIIMTRELGFPMDGSAADSVPIDPRDMLL